MTEGEFSSSVKNYRSKGRNTQPASSGLYGLAFIGAAVYYIQHATTFWEGAFGVLKALAWPAFLTYRLFEFLKM